MAGSSAIVVATLRALMDFYDIEIPQRVLPSLVLSIEREQLGIPAGLQDRVIQVYEGVVYMDFGNMETIDGFSCGQYEPIDPASLPPLYVAFSAEYSEPTEVFHNNLRFRFDQGEPAVVEAMKKFAQLTDAAKAAIEEKETGELSRLMNANFDLRRSICQLPKEHISMIETARKAGVSAKFAGSGGAIIGICETEERFNRLQKEMQTIGCICIRPAM
jgi:glucuronokinase